MLAVQAWLFCNLIIAVIQYHLYQSHGKKRLNKFSKRMIKHMQVVTGKDDITTIQ